MIYNIVSPFSLSINADSYKEAVKNFIKINYNLNINRLIIKNKNEYMKAKIDYYNKLGHKKFGVKLMPYNNGYVYPTSNVISPLSLTPTSPISHLPVSHISPIPTSSLTSIPTSSLTLRPLSPISTLRPLSPISTLRPLSPIIDDKMYSFPTKVSKKELKQKIFDLSLLNKII